MINSKNLRFINSLILILFIVLALTGLYGLVWPFPSSLFVIHRIAGWALIVLIPWKGAIALRSLSRGVDRRLSRNVMLLVSILLTLATVIILLVILIWKWQIGDYYVWIGSYAYSGIGWHWGIALGLLPLFIIHVWQRWPRPRNFAIGGRAGGARAKCRCFVRIGGYRPSRRCAVWPAPRWRLAAFRRKPLLGSSGTCRPAS